MSDAGGNGWADRMFESLDAEVSPRRLELRRMGEAVRRVINRLVGTEAPLDELARGADVLERLATDFERYGHATMMDGFSEVANSSDPHAHFDDSPIIGQSNPLAPPIHCEARDGKVYGRAVFGAAYEGPPGCVHGGFVAASFDDVLGMVQAVTGNPGMTGTLTVRYRKPTPLHAEIRFEAELDRVEGRKIFTTGRSYGPDGEVTAEAEAIFISVDFSKLVALRDQRK